MFSYEEIHGGENYVPYTSLDPLNDPKSFTFRIKVLLKKLCVAYVINFHGFWDFIKFCTQQNKPQDETNRPTFDPD